MTLIGKRVTWSEKTGGGCSTAAANAAGSGVVVAIAHDTDYGWDVLVLLHTRNGRARGIDPVPRMMALWLLSWTYEADKMPRWFVVAFFGTLGAAALAMLYRWSQDLPLS